MGTQYRPLGSNEDGDGIHWMPRQASLLLMFFKLVRIGTHAANTIIVYFNLRTIRTLAAETRSTIESGGGEEGTSNFHALARYERRLPPPRKFVTPIGHRILHHHHHRRYLPLNVILELSVHFHSS